MKKIFLLVSLLMFLSFASAETIITNSSSSDAFAPNNLLTDDICYQALSRGQSFTIGIDGANITSSITKLSYPLINSTSLGADYFVVHIQATNGTGFPGGNDIANGTLLNTSIRSGWNNITITSYNVTNPGQKYFFYFSNSTQSHLCNVMVLRTLTNTTNMYSGGQNLRNNVEGTPAWFSESALNDFYFRIYGTVASGEISVSLNLPANQVTTNSPSFVFNATLTPTLANLTNATFFIWHSNSTLFNRTTTLVTGNVSNVTTLNISTISGNFVWNVYGCAVNSTGGSLCSFAQNNYSYSIIPFNINSQAYLGNVYETSLNDFEINITTTPSILSLNSRLLYGSDYYTATSTCTSNICNIRKSIDIPLITNGSLVLANNFSWSITVFDGSTNTNFNVTALTQNVSRIFLTNCTSGSINMTLNFTAYDEENLSRINPYDFIAVFNTWLGTGTVQRNSTFTRLNLTETVLCLDPNNLTYRSDANIVYAPPLNASGTYVTRGYYLRNATLTNNSAPINLYLLKSIQSTSFILSVIDQNLQPVNDSLIFIQRFYPGLNTYYTVQIALTDNNGKSIGFFKTEDVDYRFIIVKQGNILLTTEAKKIFPETAPFTLLFRIGEPLSNIFSSYQNMSNLFYFLDYDNDTRMVTYTYIDSSGTTRYGRLLVQSLNPSGLPTTICNINSTQIAATLTCNVTNINGTIVAKAFISRSPEQLVALINQVINNLALNAFGYAGLLFTFFIVLIVALATIYSPILQIIMINISILACNIIGLSSFDPLAVFGLMAISTVIIVVLRL